MRLERAWAPALVLAASGCGAAGTDELPDNPAPQVRAAPSAVVFGRVPVGAVAAQAVRVENRGNGPSAALTLIGDDNPACSAIPAGAQLCLDLPQEVVPAGGALEGRVLFFPRAPTPPVTQAWKLACGAACALTLTGRGSGVQVPARAPPGMDFGRLRPGCAASAEVVLTSEVDVPLTVTEVRLVTAATGVYSVTLDEALPAVLPGGGALRAQLSFTAPDGDVPADLRFRLQTPGLGVADDYTHDVTVEIIGRGDTTEPGC